MPNYQYQLINSAEQKADWENFCTQHNIGYFQSHEYYNFCNSIDELEPVAIAAYHENKIVGSLLATIHYTGSGLKKYLSRRAIITGGPALAINVIDVQMVGDLLRDLNIHLKGKVIYTEFRNLFDQSEYLSVFIKHGYQYHEHLNVQLRLSDREEAMRLISGSKKRQIKQSIKEGAQIKQATNIEQVKDFYNILKDLYQHKVKKPLPTWTFFERLFHLSQDSDVIRYLLVEYNNEILGGILCPVFNGKIFEWYIGNKESPNKRVYPGVLSTWAAIEYGFEHNCTEFDFMGSGKPNEEYGVRDFKLKFGGIQVEHGRFLKKNNVILYQAGKSALRFIQKLK